MSCRLVGIPDRFDEWLSSKTRSSDPDGRSHLTFSVSELFEAFATQGPGKLQFVRMRCTRDKGASSGRHKTAYEPSHCGPLVKVDRVYVSEVESQDGSLGRELLERAYRLVPTDPKLVREKHDSWERRSASRRFDGVQF
jgi:hypothetical protein